MLSDQECRLDTALLCTLKEFTSVDAFIQQKGAFIDNACLIQNSQCKCIYEGGASMGQNGSILKQSERPCCLLVT